MMIRRVAVGIILVVIGVTATFYGFASFTQSFPAVPATLPVLATNCPGASLVATPSQIAPGSSGGIVFACSGQPAFKVSTDGSSTPTFTLPAPYTSIAIVQVPTNPYTPPTSGCTSSTSTLTLTSTTSFSFVGTLGGGNSYNYCVLYSNANISGLPIFTISWSN